MKSAKDEVRELLDNLPDDASLEDIQHNLYVGQKIQRCGSSHVPIAREVV